MGHCARDSSINRKVEEKTRYGWELGPLYVREVSISETNQRDGDFKADKIDDECVWLGNTIWNEKRDELVPIREIIVRIREGTSCDGR